MFIVRTLTSSAALLVSVGTSQALAWGCVGHQAIGIIAEHLLSPSSIAAIKSVLAAGPVDPAIKPFCQPLPSNPLGDAATWADDYRALDPSTAGWHFINFPRAIGTHTTDYKKYCPGGNCVIDAILNQYQTLRASLDPALKANALRFIVHFVGDLHQPLHTITNGDRGGNCLPVTYLGVAPVEDERHNFRPNLHGIWDEDLVRHLMTAHGLADPSGLADYVLKSGSSHSAVAKAPSPSRVASWARASDELALKVAYGKLPADPPIEPADVTLISCDDNNHLGQRLSALHETIGDAYANASGPVITSQMRLAGERLAAILKSVFP